MKRRILFLLGSLLIAGVFVVFLCREPLGRFLVESFLNHNTQEFFANTIRVQKVTLDGELRIRLEGITGNYRTRQGPVPLEVRSLVSENSLFLLLTNYPVRFTVEGFRPQRVGRQGMKGTFVFRGGKDWQSELLADFFDTDLEDLRWIDPQNLAGAAGAARGKIRYVQSAKTDPVFELDLEVPEPGGVLQARFFELFLPYLPPTLEMEEVALLVLEGQQLVQYKTAGLKVRMPRSSQMKVLLRILVLDYNLKLTLDADIRTDSKDTFFQIARLLGLMEVKT